MDPSFGTGVSSSCACYAGACRNSELVDADLRDRAAADTLMDRAQDAFGTVDILINNAVIRHFAPIEHFATEDWDEELAVNLSAAFHLVQRCLQRVWKVEISKCDGSFLDSRVDIGDTTRCIDVHRTLVACHKIY